MTPLFSMYSSTWYQVPGMIPGSSRDNNILPAGLIILRTLASSSSRSSSTGNIDLSIDY